MDAQTDLYIGKVSLKRLIRHAVIYFAAGIGLTAGADYVVDAVYHDAMLLIAGVCLGGVVAMVVLIDLEMKRRKGKQPNHGSDTPV